MTARFETDFFDVTTAYSISVIEELGVGVSDLLLNPRQTMSSPPFFARATASRLDFRCPVLGIWLSCSMCISIEHSEMIELERNLR